MAKVKGALAPADAVRLLCNAALMIHHLELTGEGISPPCRTVGEIMLQDALEYLASGNTSAARELMDLYDRWLETGETEWPYGDAPAPEVKPRPRLKGQDDEIPF